jgi:hypothetical protein
VSYPVWAWPLKPSVGMENPADQVTARSFDVSGLAVRVRVQIQRNFTGFRVHIRV